MRTLLFIITLLSFVSCSNKTKPTTAKIQTPLVLLYSPLENKSDLDILLQEIGNARIVLLGESSHGTSEFYSWRDSISGRLITEKGFNIIAVEGDWTDAYKINRYIKATAETDIEKVLMQFNRWPKWLWANEETKVFAKWLRSYNDNNPGNKTSYYGLDIFNMPESAAEIAEYSESPDTLMSGYINSFLNCFKKFNNSEQEYQRPGKRLQCEQEAGRLLNAVRAQTDTSRKMTDNELFILQSAYAARNGEVYFRTARNDRNGSWNFRDLHMLHTVNRLLNHHGPESKIIIWAHNNHVGDAKYSSMNLSNRTNLGSLLRGQFGKQVFMTGFSSYGGNVTASTRWGSEKQILPFGPAIDSSWEHILHTAGKGNKLVITRNVNNIKSLDKLIHHIGIGVVYDPAEKYSIYGRSIIPKRYDAFLFFDSSRALRQEVNGEW